MAANWSGEHGAGAPGLAPISSPSAPRRREHGHEKVRRESLRYSSTAPKSAPPPSPAWHRGRGAVRRIPTAAAATRRNEEAEEARVGESTCGAEEEGGPGVEIDGGGNGGGAVDDGVLAREDDLAGRAGAHFRWSPIPRRAADWIHGTEDDEIRGSKVKENGTGGPPDRASLALELEVSGGVSSASTGVVAVGPPKVKRAELPRNRNSDGRSRQRGGD